MEAKPSDHPEHWSVATTEVGLSVVLARICWRVEFVGAWVPNLDQIFTAPYRRVPCTCCRSLGIPGEASARLWASTARLPVRCGCTDGKVCLGIEPHDVRNSRAVGDCIGVECVASPSWSGYCLESLSRAAMIVERVQDEIGRANR